MELGPSTDSGRAIADPTEAGFLGIMSLQHVDPDALLVSARAHGTASIQGSKAGTFFAAGSLASYSTAPVLPRWASEAPASQDHQSSERSRPKCDGAAS